MFNISKPVEKFRFKVERRMTNNETFVYCKKGE